MKPTYMQLSEVDEQYDAMLASQEWRNAVRSLNHCLADQLKAAGVPQLLNGNLFYGHRKPGWVDGAYLAEFDKKRRNFFAMARYSSLLLEIGVNGGHSLLLALMSNPDLKVIGIDVCKRLARNWAHVEVYVPAAFKWLKNHFPDRVSCIHGNSLLEIPRLSVMQPNLSVDMYHLDGDKFTHLQEVVTGHNILASDALIIHDDINLGPVRKADRRLRKINLTRRVDLEELGLRETVWQGIRRKQN